MKEKKPYTLSLTISIADQGKAKAKKDLRNFSNYIEKLIKEDVKK